ncbi:hypothetical protein MRB53_038222 [Persea americana]|nr:hypothetical protein MRB53_038222 [Persea americana]
MYSFVLLFEARPKLRYDNAANAVDAVDEVVDVGSSFAEPFRAWPADEAGPRFVSEECLCCRRCWKFAKAFSCVLMKCARFCNCQHWTGVARGGRTFMKRDPSSVSRFIARWRRTSCEAVRRLTLLFSVGQDVDTIVTRLEMTKTVRHSPLLDFALCQGYNADAPRGIYVVKPARDATDKIMLHIHEAIDALRRAPVLAYEGLLELKGSSLHGPIAISRTKTQHWFVEEFSCRKDTCEDSQDHWTDATQAAGDCFTGFALASPLTARIAQTYGLSWPSGTPRAGTASFSTHSADCSRAGCSRASSQT